MASEKTPLFFSPSSTSSGDEGSWLRDGSWVYSPGDRQRRLAGGGLAGHMATRVDGLERLIHELHSLSRELGGPRDSHRLRARAHAARVEAGDAARDIAEEFRQERSDDENVGLGRVLRQFEAAVQRMQDATRTMARLEREHPIEAGSASGPESFGAATGRGSLPRGVSTPGPALLMEDGGEVEELIIEDVTADLRVLERDVAALEEIFAEVRDLVEEQADALDQVEENVDSTAARTAAARDDLVVARSRWRVAPIIGGVLFLACICTALFILAVALIIYFAAKSKP